MARMEHLVELGDNCDEYRVTVNIEPVSDKLIGRNPISLEPPITSPPNPCVKVDEDGLEGKAIPDPGVYLRAAYPRGAFPIDRAAAVAVFGVPGAVGEFIDDKYDIINSDTGDVHGVAEPYEFYDDGSAKILRVTASEDVFEVEVSELEITSHRPTRLKSNGGIEITPAESGFQIAGLAELFVLDGGVLSSPSIARAIPYIEIDGIRYPFAATAPATIDIQNDWFALIISDGKFENGLLGRVYWTFRAGAEYVEYRVELRLPQDAERLTYAEAGMEVSSIEPASMVYTFATLDGEALGGNSALELYQGYRISRNGWGRDHYNDTHEYTGEVDRPQIVGYDKIVQQMPGVVEGGIFVPDVHWTGARLLGLEDDPPVAAGDEIRWLEAGGLSYTMQGGPVTPGSGFRATASHVDTLFHFGPIPDTMEPASNRTFTGAIGVNHKSGEELYAAIEYPVVGHASFERVRATGMFFGVTSIPSIEAEEKYWNDAAPRNSWSPTRNMPLLRMIHRTWRRSYWEYISWLIAFCRGGPGGQYLQAQEFTRYLMDEGILRTPESDYSEAENRASYRKLGQNQLDGAHQTTAVLFAIWRMTTMPWYEEAIRDYGETLLGRAQQGFFDVSKAIPNLRAWLRNVRALAMVWEAQQGRMVADANQFFPASALRLMLDSEPDEYTEETHGAMTKDRLRTMSFSPGIDPAEGWWYTGTNIAGKLSRTVHSFFAPHLFGDTMQVLLPILARWAASEPEDEAREELSREFTDAVDAFCLWTVQNMLQFKEDGTPYMLDDYFLDNPDANKATKNFNYLLSWVALRAYEITGGEIDHTEAAEAIAARKFSTSAGHWMRWKLQSLSLINHAIHRGEVL